MPEPTKIKLSVISCECECCGSFDVYFLYVGDKEIASLSTHFGEGDFDLTSVSGIFEALRANMDGFNYIFEEEYSNQEEYWLT
jgi:hypothetical protein